MRVLTESTVSKIERTGNGSSAVLRVTVDGAKAQEYCRKAAQFNSLPQLNYSFIRAKAQKAAAAKKA